ncbi:MAG: glycosyltransferase family 2 protein [Thermoanaerobaculia bacterium]
MTIAELARQRPVVPLRAEKPGTAAPRPELAPKVSVLIVTWNSAAWIGRCLGAVPAACGDVPWEVIVHDNASSDETVDLARGFRDRVSVASDDANSGFAGGMNRALERARGEYVLFLNPDCELDPDSVRTLASYLDSEPAVAAVAPLLHGEDGLPQREFQLRRFPTVRSLVSDLLLLDELIPSNGAAHSYRYRDLDISLPQAVEQPAGAALMVRRSVLQRVGSFDERFFPAWFEDVDLCRRLWESGGAIHLVPSARATHRGGVCLDHVEFAEFLSIWYRNLALYASKWFRRGDVELLRIATLLGMSLRILATAAGLGRSPLRRRETLRAYRRVLGEAFRRWEESPSS